MSITRLNGNEHVPTIAFDISGKKKKTWPGPGWDEIFGPLRFAA
jgi:hypothetical protein